MRFDEGVLPVIVPQDSQSIEDRGGVPQNVKCGPHIDGALKLILKRDWGFANLPVSKETTNHKKLEVEREPLDRKQRFCFLQHLPPKKFQSSLGIANVKIE